MGTLKVLLATSKGYPEAEAAEAAEAVRRHVAKKNPEHEVVVLQAAKEFADTAGRWEGWQGWIDFVGSGRGYGAGEPNYHLVVSPVARVGKATAGIFSKRLESGLPAALLLPDGTVSRVVEVRTVDDRDWRGGWELDVVPF